MNSIIFRIAIIFFCFFSLQVVAQDYLKYSVLINNTKYLISKQQTDSALEIYSQIFLSYEKLFPYDNLTAAKIYASKKDTVMTIKIVADMIKNGSSLNEIIENNESIFSFVSKTKLWNDLKYIKPEVDYETIIEISKWLALDQFIRNRADDICIYKYLAEVDSINTINLFELIKKQGFPGFYKLGIYTNDIILLIMHSSTNPSTDKYWEFYFKPLLLSEAKKGNISYNDFAVITDRYQNYKYGNQIYGTFNYRDSFITIENIKEVDNRRAEIGLPKLYIEAKRKRIPLPKDYKP